MLTKLIKDTRARLGVTQARLAEVTGWNQSTICRVEKNDKVAPVANFEEMAGLLLALGLRVQVVDEAGAVVWEAENKLK